MRNLKKWRIFVKSKVRKLCISILKDLGVFLVFILFLLAIGIVTNIAMGITINEYMLTT